MATGLISQSKNTGIRKFIEIIKDAYIQLRCKKNGSHMAKIRIPKALWIEPTIPHPWQPTTSIGSTHHSVPAIPESRPRGAPPNTLLLCGSPCPHSRHQVQGEGMGPETGDSQVTSRFPQIGIRIYTNDYTVGCFWKKRCRIQRQKIGKKRKMGRDGDGQACTSLLNHLLSLPGKHCAAWCWLYHCGSYERRQAEGFGEGSHYGNWKEHTWRQIHRGLRGWDGWVSERKEKKPGGGNKRV